MEYSTLILIICLLITLLSTAIGSSFVFFFRKNLGPKAKSIILGFAGGIMVAAAFFGLLMPSIEQSQTNSAYSGWSFVPPVVGFLLGGLLLFGLDKAIPHFHKMQNVEEGPKND
jgi:zinc transporter, ZIP family